MLYHLRSRAAEPLLQLLCWLARCHEAWASSLSVVACSCHSYSPRRPRAELSCSTGALPLSTRRHLLFCHSLAAHVSFVHAHSKLWHSMWARGVSKAHRCASRV